MSETVLVAIVGIVGPLAGAVLQASVASHRHRFTEARIIQDAIADNQRLWMYNRKLIDHIYKEKGPPPPEPPEDLFEHDPVN